MNTDELRQSIENFTEEMSKESYRQHAGLATEVNFKQIYDKYPKLFTIEHLTQIKSGLSNPDSNSDDQRRFKIFREAFYSEILSDKIQDLDTDLFKCEGGSMIEIEPGRQVPYRNIIMHVMNEHNRERRKSIVDLQSAFESAELTPIHENIFVSEQEYINNLGFENKVEMFQNLSGINLYALNDIMQKFLNDTEDIYIQYLEKFAKERLNLDVKDLERHDLNFIIRTEKFDTIFPKESMFRTVSEFVNGMGIDISSGSNIIFDMDARDNKSTRAFCSPVKIPSEVYLVIYPAGGESDYTTFLHELGHALHYSNVNAQLPFECKRYGDNSVTEGYAMIFDQMTMNEEWMDKNLDVNRKNNNDYFINRVFNELLSLRRSAASLDYEIKLNQTQGLTGKKEIYSEIMDKALKVKSRPDKYLIDVDQFFYCARYLRAWMFRANINEYMKTNFGNIWFTDKRAGDMLMNMWSMGQKYNADELSEMYGGNKLSTDFLLNNIKSVLLN